MWIREILEQHSSEYPDDDGNISVHQNIRWTYHKFLERVDEVNPGLMGLGVEKVFVSLSRP